MSVSPAGRLLCPQCGVNNFDTQAACWKCGAALAGPPRSTNAAGPQGAAASTLRPAAADAPYQPATTVDPALAVWSAWILAFLFPFLAVPVGLIFLMLDDRRKIHIGKTTLIAGTIFSLLHLLATWALLQPVISVARGLGALSGRSSSQSARPDDPVAPLQLPGIPQTTPATPVPFPAP